MSSVGHCEKFFLSGSEVEMSSFLQVRDIADPGADAIGLWRRFLMDAQGFGRVGAVW